MARHGKRYRQSRDLLDQDARYGLADAVELLISMPVVKFDESIELHARLGIDPTHAEQQVRGTVTLPHGTGRDMRVIVFADGDKAQEARDAGAHEVGTDELAKKIQEGWVEFDAAVATPDNMRIIGPCISTVPRSGCSSCTIISLAWTCSLLGSSMGYLIGPAGTPA